MGFSEKIKNDIEMINKEFDGLDISFSEYEEGDNRLFKSSRPLTGYVIDPESKFSEEDKQAYLKTLNALNSNNS